MSNFCLQQGQVLKALVAPLHKLPLSEPSPLPWDKHKGVWFQTLEKEIKLCRKLLE